MTKSDLTFIPEFYDRYIALISEDINLVEELKNTIVLFDEYTDVIKTHENYRYKPEKWTPKEVLQHIIDTERIFAYRALALSRAESKNIMGFDENSYAQHSKANNRTIESLLQEYSLVRQGTIALFESFDKDTLSYEGTCSNIKISVLAIGFVIIGHAKHHLNILNDRYF